MNRIQKTADLVKNKDVIDIGSIGHNIERAKNPNWLHRHLVDSANYVLGVDILMDDINKANELGYNFIYGDAENLEEYVDRKFDVCVAGELIEHLSNPGLFLDSVKKILKDDGIIILSTPNVLALGNVLRILKPFFRLQPKKINEEHKAWYYFETLTQLLEAHGFKVEKIVSVRPGRENNFVSGIKEKIYKNSNSKIFCVAKNK